MDKTILQKNSQQNMYIYFNENNVNKLIWFEIKYTYICSFVLKPLANKS